MGAEGLEAAEVNDSQLNQTKMAIRPFCLIPLCLQTFHTEVLINFYYTNYLKMSRIILPQPVCVTKTGVQKPLEHSICDAVTDKAGSGIRFRLAVPM